MARVEPGVMLLRLYGKSRTWSYAPEVVWQE